MLVLKDIKSIINNGGCSLNYKQKNEPIKTGYMVALEGHETQVNASDLKQVKKVVNAMLQKYAKRGQYVGVWVDNNIAYIDVSKRVSTKAKALAMGRANHQLAIWNNYKGLAINC